MVKKNPLDDLQPSAVKLWWAFYALRCQRFSGASVLPLLRLIGQKRSGANRKQFFKALEPLVNLGVVGYEAETDVVHFNTEKMEAFAKEVTE